MNKFVKLHTENVTQCAFLTDNHTGCFLHDNESLFNGIFSSFYLLLATIILIINICALTIFLKNKDSPCIFTNISFVMLIFFNILGVFLTYYMSFATCFIDSFSHFSCVFKYCFYYFLGHELNMANFVISIERLVSVKWAFKYQKIVNKSSTIASIIGLSMIAASLSFFDIITYNQPSECICAMNSILSTNYVLINNFAFFLSSITTAIIYFYIYFLVKSIRKRVENHRKSIGSSLILITNNSKLAIDNCYLNEPSKDNENSNISTIHNKSESADSKKKRSTNEIKRKSTSLNQKMKVLKVQTFIFCIFF